MPAPEHDAYAAIAEWYDIEHVALTEDIEWLHELIGARVAGRAHVLEVGAGTGRIAAGLAVAGLEVTAVEPSTAMRALAQKRLAALPERVARRVHVVAGSATELGVDPTVRFDAGVFGLDTFAHVTTQDERLHALAAVRAQLRPGGVLILDLDLVGLRRLAEAPGRLWHQGTWRLSAVSATERYVTHGVCADPAREPGLVTLTHFYEVYDQGGSVARTVSQMTLALLSRGEMELALLHTGYVVEAIAGGYAGEPFEDGAGRALFVATPA